MRITRRRLIAASAAGLAFTGFGRLAGQAIAQGSDAYLSEVSGYGALVADHAGELDLPEGFSYTVVSRAKEPMADGFLTPHKLDGMGCFAAGPDQVVLVRNHEIKPLDLDLGPFGEGRRLADRLPPGRAFDVTDDGLPMVGGTTRLIYDLKARRLVSDHLSLAGTLANCAGGVTPWGSWLSCEETTQGKGIEARKDHGWVFEVPARGEGLVDPVPIAGLGRFRHEAVAVDPRTGVVYLTEDESDGQGLFYRFLPNDRTRLSAGGRLQALALPEADADPRNRDGRYWGAGDWRKARWIDLAGTDNPYEDLRFRGQRDGAAWFARGEGIHLGNGEFFFACTSGGPSGYGQIMRYVPSPAEGQAGEAEAPGRLQLFCEPENPRLMEMGDNLVVAPWGHLIVCEDKTGGADNYLRGVTPEGRIYTLARRPGGTELAGACFSPDGSTLFVNAYLPGTTFAITGPWARFRA